MPDPFTIEPITDEELKEQRLRRLAEDIVEDSPEYKTRVEAVVQELRQTAARAGAEPFQTTAFSGLANRLNPGRKSRQTKQKQPRSSSDKNLIESGLIFGEEC